MASAAPRYFEEASERNAPSNGSTLRAAATGGMLWVGVVFVLSVVATQDWLAALLAY